MIFMLNECAHSFTCRVSCSFCHIYSEEKQCKQMCPDVCWTDGFPRFCVQNKFETLDIAICESLNNLHNVALYSYLQYTVCVFFSSCNNGAVDPEAEKKRCFGKLNVFTFRWQLLLMLWSIYLSVTVPSWQRHIGGDIECFAKKHTFFQTLC